MLIVPRFPPKNSCGLEPGARVIVTEDFEMWGTWFRKGEELVFKREMWDRDTGFDAFVFGTPESVERERALPEINSPDDLKRWLQECPEKAIYGHGEYRQPADWLRHFRGAGQA